MALDLVSNKEWFGNRLTHKIRDICHGKKSASPHCPQAHYMNIACAYIETNYTRKQVSNPLRRELTNGLTVYS